MLLIYKQNLHPDYELVIFYKYKNHQYNTNCDNSINNSKQYNRINFVCFF